MIFCKRMVNICARLPVGSLVKFWNLYDVLDY